MISVDVVGLDQFQSYFDEASARSKKAASLALNQTADRVVVPRSRDLILEQVNFPAGYLNKDRLYVKQRASPDRLDARVAGRDRATSLLRFASAAATRGGATVQVRPGSSRTMRRAFVINLRNGNQGLAIRLKPGETISNRRLSTTPFGKGLVLLYGPSVNQVFLSVADQLTPEFLDRLSDEFLRQFARDNL